MCRCLQNAAYFQGCSDLRGLNGLEGLCENHIYSFKQSVRDHKEDGVILATMHRSKGLEWDHVFVIDCCAGTVPFQRRKTIP